MKPDSLIFDMDGTLWDAVDTYAYSWTQVLKEMGIDKTLTKQDIQGYMGMEAKQIYKEIFPQLPEETIEQIYRNIIVKTDELLPKMGGNIYPDVLEGIEQLSRKYKLFMLSNCQKGSIRDFMVYTETKPYFCDYIEYGSNHQPKHINMKTLIDRYNLKAPMYIGDTDSDRKQSDLAYVPFVFVSWGFGKTDSYAHKFDTMKDLTEYFMNL
ncbi:HAD family hydrolase [Dysgonomonas sp. HDW5A]|uniref:HAD family hydrolase n=1 Tax=unclassified Dysgonomonas TaxID=2630389 RepID=UPI00140E3D88|nr:MULTISPECIES: HAD hydrolase-like protein [unclassified Dysgonomonas]QIK55393.1 HAD family hydrolase [Dysgonomonas sp. HDW5B]QIK60817.1 HAD family hydrolase [Dysgonomonas sp. HDW5A]